MKRFITPEEVKLVPENELDVFLLGMVYKKTFETTDGWASVEATGKGVTHVSFSAKKLRGMFGVSEDSSLSALVERILIET